MSGEIAGPGFIVKISPDGSSYTAIARIRDVKGPEQTLDTVEVTNQDSPNFFKEWTATLLDGGLVTFPMSLLDADASQASLQAAQQARTLMFWEVLIGATGKAFFWQGYVTKFGFSGPVHDVALIDVEIRVTGPVTGPSAVV